jgi:pimeloyl-ACP methyl ester carboxylesterase
VSCTPRHTSKERKTTSTDTPTIVLVHGGFADASFWAPVIKDLQAHHLPVLAPPNPLRGLAHDAEYLATYVNQIDGPVLLVGHSYGGAVISVAGASTPNAVGLVYVAAFALDEGESFGEIFGRFGETPLVGAVRPSNYPLPDGESAVELTIAPELYQEAFAADLSEDVTRVLAVSQRPFAAIFEDRAQAAAWKTLPSWAVVATADKAIPPDAERHMARRAGAEPIEVDASHSIALSQPKAVADLIRTAVNATSAAAVGG